jgi:exosome complex component RRP40
VRNEYVIGIVVSKSSETIKVDIGSSEYASLSWLAFENATKRNKPNVEIADLVYCRVLTGSKDMEPELVCIDAAGKANGLGVLKEGFMFKVNLELSRRFVIGLFSMRILNILSKLIFKI